MLVSDGLTRAQFTPLWRDAMWHATALAERGRLVLQYARLEVREKHRVLPTVTAWTGRADEPLLVITLAEAPLRLPALELDELRTQLASVGGHEVHTSLSVVAGIKDGIQSYLLVTWSEDRDGVSSCWLQPYRFTADGLEEGMAMQMPRPTEAPIARHLAGLLRPHH